MILLYCRETACPKANYSLFNFFFWLTNWFYTMVPNLLALQAGGVVRDGLYIPWVWPCTESGMLLQPQFHAHQTGFCPQAHVHQIGPCCSSPALSIGNWLLLPCSQIHACWIGPCPQPCICQIGPCHSALTSAPSIPDRVSLLHLCACWQECAHGAMSSVLQGLKMCWWGNSVPPHPKKFLDPWGASQTRSHGSEGQTGFEHSYIGSRLVYTWKLL